MIVVAYLGSKHESLDMLKLLNTSRLCRSRIGKPREFASEMYCC